MQHSPRKSPAAAGGGGGDAVLVHELTRLRNELRLKDHHVEEKMLEIQTLKGTILKKDEALERAEGELSAMRDKVLSAESDVLSLRRQLATTEAERDQLRREAEAVSREADGLSLKLRQQVGKGSDDGGAHAEDVARLSNLLHELKLENDRLVEDNKGAYNVIRAKDQELDGLATRAAHSEQASSGCGGGWVLVELKTKENIIADLRRQLSEARAELGDSQRVRRLKAQELGDVQQELEKTSKELATTSEYLSGVMAELAVAQDKLHASRVEVKDLQDQMMRAGLAATRARSEALAVARESSIPVLQHLEEVKYMQGEIHRLKQQLQHVEQERRAAAAQRERLYRRIDALAATGSALAAARPVGAAPDSVGSVGQATVAALEAGTETVALDSPQELIAALRAELAETREMLAMREDEAAALNKQNETGARRAARFRLDAQRLKHRLFQAMGPASFAAEFGEGEPPAADEATADALAQEEQEAAREACAAAHAQAALHRALQQLAAKEQEVAQLRQQQGLLAAVSVAAGGAAGGAASVGAPAQLAAELAEAEASAEEAGTAADLGTAAEGVGAVRGSTLSTLAGAEAGAGGDHAGGWAAPAAQVQRQQEQEHVTAVAAAGLATPAAGDSLATVGSITASRAAAAALAGDADAIATHQPSSSDEQAAADAASLRMAAEAIGQKSLELAAAQEKVGQLQRRVKELKQHAVDLEQQLEEAANSGEEESEEEEEEEQAGSASAADRAALQATLDAAEARQRNRERGSGSIWFGGGQRDDPLQAAGMTKDRLALVLERLMQQREASKRAPKSYLGLRMRPALPCFQQGSADSKDDAQLFEEATSMLKGELARLGAETVKKMEENEKLRSEVGELKTARFTAEAMATRLEEMNALSMQVAGLKMELARANAAIHELSKKKKKRSPMRKLRKTLSHATEGLSKGLHSWMHDPAVPQGQYAQQAQQSPLAQPGRAPAAAPPAGGSSGRPSVPPSPAANLPFPGAGSSIAEGGEEGKAKGSWLKMLAPRRSSKEEAA
eukprot:scaffold18.g1995.t1